MKHHSNTRLIQIWKSLSLEVAACGFAQTDHTWKKEGVCSPYSRIYYIPDGEGTLTIDGKEFALCKGHIYLIPAGLLYDYRCDIYMEQLYFHVNITMPNGMDLFYGGREVYGRDIGQEQLEEVQGLYWSTAMGDTFRLQGILWEETGRFAQMAGIRMEQMKRHSELVEQLFELAQNPVSIQNHVRLLADRMHVSESTLSKRFRAETGMSPGSYLGQLVTQKACRLLIQSDKSIAGIAEELGFEDPFYFTKFFKRQMNLPPGTYRKQMREG